MPFHGGGDGAAWQRSPGTKAPSQPPWQKGPIKAEPTRAAGRPRPALMPSTVAEAGGSSVAAHSSLDAWADTVTSGPAGGHLFELPDLEPEWRPPVRLITSESLGKFDGENTPSNQSITSSGISSSWGVLSPIYVLSVHKFLFPNIGLLGPTVHLSWQPVIIRPA